MTPWDRAVKLPYPKKRIDEMNEALAA